ncbi:MAG TPA: prepilin-type N-terminal cleavage/methylation domain-containing protein [Thermoanaerobaculia bacterium]
MQSRSQRGFTMVEVMVVVLIVGILAAIAIANYLGSLNRARQKKTVADIRTIGTVWEARQSEQQRYNAAGLTFPPNTMPYAQLQTLLVPTYTKTLPQLDGWGRPLQFGVNSAGGGAATEYAIRSAGGDGVFDTEYTAGMTQDPDCDIVFENGAFVVYPDTVQTK